MGEGSFVRTMANSSGFGNLVAQVPRMLLELTSGPVSVISTSGSFLPPEEYAKLECALPALPVCHRARATLPRAYRAPDRTHLLVKYSSSCAHSSARPVGATALSISLLARACGRAKSEIDNAVAPTGRADECAQLDEYLTRRCVRSGAL